MAKKKVLIFGATGMAGHVVYYYLQKTNKYDISNVVFRNKLTNDSIVLDVSDKFAVENLVKTIRPQFIINCIGVLVGGSRKHPDNAIFLNAYFPHLLKRLSDEIDAKLIHISTDCVFSGKKGNYAEDDFRDADDIYGRSKALGEVLNDKDLTIRTSIIGPELKENGEGLFHWFMLQKGSIKGFSKAIWGGVTTLELAKAIDIALQNNLIGLVQLSNGESIDKYSLLSLFKEIWNKENVFLIEDDNVIVDKSIQSSNKFEFNVPSYRTMLVEQYDWMTSNKKLYVHYEDFNS